MLSLLMAPCRTTITGPHAHYPLQCVKKSLTSFRVHRPLDRGNVIDLTGAVVQVMRELIMLQHSCGSDLFRPKGFSHACSGYPAQAHSLDCQKSPQGHLGLLL